MAKIYGTPIMAGGAGGANKDLPPLLDNFKAKTTKLYIGEGNTISKLPSDSKVKLGSYNGQSLRWIVARDSVTHELRLVLDKDSVATIGTMQFDAPEPSNPDSARQSSGNNRYSVSNIHQWLNSDGAANEWYTAQHEYDAPPDYQNKTGFLNEWPEVDKSILKETDWSTILATIDGGETETINAKMALMSETELGLEEDTGGNKLDIFNADGDRATGSYYLTRTPNPGTSIYAWQVTPSGSNTVNAVKSAYGVRPICAPNPNTIVSETTDEDGCYTIGADGVEISADKMLESRANELAGAVWVYGDHEPESVNDGTKIQLTREEVLASSLNSLTSGSKVKLGTYDGEPLKWIVARDSVTQDLRLVLDKDSVTAIGNMQYDAKEPNNPDSDRKSYGNNKYSVSNINQWLNSDGAANEWYTAQHEYDAAPDYQNKAGFLNEWSEADKSVLQETNWTTTLSSVDGGGVDTFSRKVVLMSTTELGLEEDTGGSRLDIFNSDGDRAIGSYYWTRTPYPSDSGYAWRVSSAGSRGGGSVGYAYGVRPICSPNPSTPISGPDDEGYYTIGGVATVQKTVQWNNEADFFARQFTYNSKKQYQTMLEGAIATLILTGVPDPVTELAEQHSGSSITLTWKNPTSDEFYDHTVVVYKTDAFPTAIDDGTQGYSGTDETATLSGLELGTTYYIAVFTVSAYGLYGEPQTVQVEIPAGQLLSSLASGTKVKLGKWNNTDLQWKVARDTSDQSIRLVLEPTSVSLLGNKMYDNKEPSNSDTDRRNYGNNRYIYSNIHQWLNATKATGWYTAQHSTDAAPDYSSQAGFLSGWSENHIAALDRATLTVSRSSTDGGGTETFVSGVALMSTTELGLESGTGNGRLDIFNSNGDRATGSFYWTRTPYPSFSYGVWQVNTTGTLYMNYYAFYASGVRPLCSPRSTALVSLEMDGDNCYVVQ